MTLTDFLLARIAEDEAVARKTVVLADPARVLAECAAKRRIVATWERRWDEAENAANNPNLSVGERNSMNGMFASQATGLGEAIRLLALPYADHPDYNPDWRP